MTVEISEILKNKESEKLDLLEWNELLFKGEATPGWHVKPWTSPHIPSWAGSEAHTAAPREALCSSVGENTRELTVNMAACQAVVQILFVLFCFCFFL